MKPKILIIILGLFSVFVSSCFERKTIRVELRDVDKQMIPYELGQTVSFIDSLGQIFDVTVTKDTIVWEIMDEYSGGHFSWEQIREVRLQCNLSNFVMNLRVARNLIIVYHLNYYFWIPYDDKGNFRKGYYYDRVYQHIHNSLDINGKTYYDVLEYRFELRPWSLLYNKKEGILQMSDEDKVIFTIYK